MLVEVDRECYEKSHHVSVGGQGVLWKSQAMFVEVDMESWESHAMLVEVDRECYKSHAMVVEVDIECYEKVMPW